MFLCFFSFSLSFSFQFIISESIKGSEDLVLGLSEISSCGHSDSSRLEAGTATFLPNRGCGVQGRHLIELPRRIHPEQPFLSSGKKNGQSDWLEQCTCQVLPGTENEGHVSQRAEGK